MKKLYNFSIKEVKEYFIKHGFEKFDIMLFNIYGNYLNKQNNILINNLDTLDLQKYKTNVESKYININFIKDQNKFYFQYHIDNNKISNISKIFYRYYFKLNFIEYFFQSEFNYLKSNDSGQESIIFQLDLYPNKYLYKDNEFYNIEDLPKITNNLVFL